MKKRVHGAVSFVFELADLYFTKHISRSAAELAYFLILTFFPVLICINAFIGTLDLDVDAVLSGMESILPVEAMPVVGEYVGYITNNQSHGMLFAGVVMLLFSASAAMRALMNVMDDIYGRKSYTGLWQVVASVAFSVLFLFTIYLSMVVLLTGNWCFHLLERLFHLDSVSLPWDWQWMRFLILFCLVLVFVLLVYRLSAPRGKPRPPVLTGALVASAALVLFSMLFSVFIGLSSRYSLVYGSLASLIILLVWLYLCGNIVIMGNAINCVWYKRKKKRLEGRA